MDKMKSLFLSSLLVVVSTSGLAQNPIIQTNYTACLLFIFVFSFIINVFEHCSFSYRNVLIDIFCPHYIQIAFNYTYHLIFF